MGDGRWKMEDGNCVPEREKEILAPTYVGGYGLVAANLSSG